MMKTALYTGGNRLPGKFYRVDISRSHSHPKERVLISPEAVRRAPGEVFGMTWKGLQHRSSTSSPPFVLFRNRFHAAASKLFVSRHELAALAGFFDLPVGVVSGGFFTAEPFHFSQAGTLSLVPRWEELTDPVWRKAFLGWIARERRLPEINEIAPWPLFSSTMITMPAMADASIIHNVHGREEGRLVLHEHQGEPRAFFDQGNEKRTAFALSLDRTTGKDHIEILGFSRPSRKENFDRTALAALFGQNPSATVYLCSKRALAKEGIGLGNIGGLRFVIESGRVRFKKGKLYFFRFERTGLFLKIECFEDEARRHLHGFANIELLEGFPGQSITCLEQEQSD